jgi:hypothetical protein
MEWEKNNNKDLSFAQRDSINVTRKGGGKGLTHCSLTGAEKGTRKKRSHQKKIDHDPECMTEDVAKRADFNSWIIGGQYTKNSFKRQVGSGAPSNKVELDDGHKQQLEARRLKLKEDREKFCAEYKPKLVSGLREKRDYNNNAAVASGSSGPPPPPPATAAAAASTARRADAPPRTASPPTNTNKVDDSLALRNRLRDSFAQITATHAYGTLFPPLLTPYNRPCLVSHNPSDRPKSPVQELTDQTPEKVLPLSNENSLSVTKNERRRVQPISGPKAFFPTGSTTAAYRHFCNPN